MRTSLCLVILALLGSAAFAQSGPAADAPGPPEDVIIGDILVTASPSVLILGLQGEWLTIHTDIPLRVVDRDSVEVNGMPADSVFADSRGYLVAKFDQLVTQSMVAPPSATLTLTGYNLETETWFSGTDTVEVKDLGKK